MDCPEGSGHLKALARITPANTKPGRYQPPDQLLAFLESL
jgi:hypothetical protein